MPAIRPPDYTDGPILDFLSQAEAFDAVHLLYDPPKDELGAVAALTNALTERERGRIVGTHLVPVDDPRHYRDLYKYFRATCSAVEAAHPAASFHVLLTPGTPQVHATWVLLAKTIFPATPWQTSESAGASRAEIADIPFDVQAELVEPACDRVTSSARLLDVPGLIFRSDAMTRAVQEVGYIAEHSETPILLLGETGVGKERLAKYAHSVSPRKEGPFVGLNCAALPAHLVESELFGHMRGAFTGADRDREGLFEAASSGTLFLDEVGEFALDVQAKLLRIVQERQLRRVGSTREIAVNPRIIAATNQDLREMIKEKRFRGDLYYRLAVSPVKVPALRDRPADIAPLVDHFLALRNKDRRRRRRPEIRLSAAALRLLEEQPWMGNVRELENTIERVGLLAEGGLVTAKELKALLSELVENPLDVTTDLNVALDELARRLISQALALHGTQENAARALGLKSGSALQGRMKTLGMWSNGDSHPSTRRAQRR